MSLSNNMLISRVPYAFSKKLNRFVGVEEVERGLKCDCICPSCKMRLISRKGDSNIHHFAHWEEATEPCSYSYWVSIRDMATQILKEIKCIEIERYLPQYYKPPFLNSSKTIHFYSEIDFNDKNGMDIFFKTNIAPLGIRFLTLEQEREEYKNPCYFLQHLVLIIDIKGIARHQKQTKETLRDIILNNAQIHAPMRYTLYKKENTEKIFADFCLKYERLYQSKSIMEMEDFKTFGLNPMLINHFIQNDFSAINIAKVYYQTMGEHFGKNKPENQHYRVLHEGKLHSFIVCNDEFYATALIMNKFFIFQVTEDRIVLLGSTFKKDDGVKSIITNTANEKKDDNQDRETLQRRYPTLF
jgi:hypothetical protein